MMLNVLVSLSLLAAPVRLTEQDAVARALAGHPALAAGAARVRAAEGLRSQAALRPNPRFTIQTENARAWGAPGFNFGSEADTFAYGSQMFETAGKRARRTETAAAAVRRAELEREAAARRIGAQVRQAYWRAAAAVRLRDLLTETAATFQQIVDYHAARVREGAMAEADLIRVQLEGQRLDIEVNSAALEADRARIHLFREMGGTEFPEVEFAGPLEPSAAIVDVNVPVALERRPDLRLARQEVEQARAAQRLESARAKPDFDLLFGYKRAAGFNTLIGGAEIQLPFLNRNQGAIAAAGHEVRAAEASLAAADALARAEIQAASREFEVRRRQVLESLPALRERAEQASRIAQAAYREGGTDLLRLLDAERARIESRILYYRALGEYHQSRVTLETALGVEP
jgi:cobalt-zinc-cadmium efflux system outer membrane protein